MQNTIQPQPSRSTRVDDKMFLPLKDENPLHRIGFQFVTVSLIAACVLVWLVQAQGGEAFDARLVFRFGLIPETILGDRRRDPEMALATPWLTLFTSMFLHGGFLHLFGNMVYLWVFGDNVEDSMGHWRFACFYLLCGAAAGITHAVAGPSSVTPTIGASGAVSGVPWCVFHALSEKRCLGPGLRHAGQIPRVERSRSLDRRPIDSCALVPVRVAEELPGTPIIGGFVAGALLVIPMRKPELPLRHLERVPFGPWSHPRQPRRLRTGPWGKPASAMIRLTMPRRQIHEVMFRLPIPTNRRDMNSSGPWGKRFAKTGFETQPGWAPRRQDRIRQVEAQVIR